MTRTQLLMAYAALDGTLDHAVERLAIGRSTLHAMLRSAEGFEGVSQKSRDRVRLAFIANGFEFLADNGVRLKDER